MPKQEQFPEFGCTILGSGGGNATVIHSPEEICCLTQVSARQGATIRLKRCFAGNFGHLGNAQLMKTLEELLSENMRYLLLAHIRRECNDCDLVESLTENVLSNCIGKMSHSTWPARRLRSTQLLWHDRIPFFSSD